MATPPKRDTKAARARALMLARRELFARIYRTELPPAWAAEAEGPDEGLLRYLGAGATLRAAEALQGREPMALHALFLHHARQVLVEVAVFRARWGEKALRGLFLALERSVDADAVVDAAMARLRARIQPNQEED